MLSNDAIKAQMSVVEKKEEKLSKLGAELAEVKTAQNKWAQ